MAKKKRVPKPADYSLTQLQQLIETKQSELAELKAKRAELQKELDELDQQISETEGNGEVAPTAVSTKPAVKKKKKKKKKKRVAVKKRAKNQRTAKEYAMEILGKEKGGLPLKALADRILSQGYKTTSKNFSNALYQVLHNARTKGETFDVDEKTGNWVLRK